MAMSQSECKKKNQERRDPQYSGFLGYNNGEPQTIDMWADMLEALFQNVIPASTAVSAAKTAFKTAAVGMSTIPGGAAILVSAINVFVGIVGTGMTGYVATPPVYTISDIGDPSLNVPNQTDEFGSGVKATKLYSKGITGMATLTPPGTPTVNWS